MIFIGLRRGAVNDRDMGVHQRRILFLFAGFPGILGLSAHGFAADQPNDGNPASDRDIVVYGVGAERQVLAGMRADSELDENGVASYGRDTVGDLLGDVLRQVGNSEEGPFVLINGQPATGLSEISDLPAEAVTKIQLLPRQAAGLLGQSPTRRVVNVVIKPDHRQVTTKATGSFATAGQGFGAEGELNLLSLNNGNRRSFVLRAKHVDPLFEADRSIVGDAEGKPYDFAGNILSFPFAGGEIDPALSTLVGQIVVVTGVPPGQAAPSLADFAARANVANRSSLGTFRTLLSEQQIYTANANITQRLSPRTTLSLNLIGEHSRAMGFLGVGAVDLRLPATSPFSPFDQDVLLARFLGDPLRQNQEATSVTVATILNTQLGRWRLSLNSNFIHRVSTTNSDRSFDATGLQSAVTAGILNPFASISDTFLQPFARDRAHSNSDSGSTVLTASGSPFSMPSGPVNAALRFEWRLNRSQSTTVGSNFSSATRLRRNESIARLSLQLPLIGGIKKSPVGDLSLELSGALRHVTASGGLEDFGYGLNWQLGDALTLRAAVSQEQIAPPPNSLTDPIIVIEGYRTFDFIQQETVLVRFVTGGNPDLDVEKRRTTTIGGTLRPLADIDLSLNAEYSNVRGRDVFAALPPVNAEVQAAFPDRFQRDAGGRLILVDARLVPFSRVRREQVRWGFDFARTFGRTPTGTRGAAAPGGDRDDLLIPGWRVNAFAAHSWALSYTRLARPGLPIVDLLAGGAIGYGGGQPRHVVQFGAGVAHGGYGLQLDGNWVGRSRITAGTIAAPTAVSFAPRTRLDMRFFVNLGPQFPDSRLARGARLAVEVENLFDSKQRVTDQTGTIPLRYQPYLLDPLGRVVRISLRKIF
jgi:hypothetical protein